MSRFQEMELFSGYFYKATFKYSLLTYYLEDVIRLIYEELEFHEILMILQQILKSPFCRKYFEFKKHKIKLV